MRMRHDRLALQLLVLLLLLLVCGVAYGAPARTSAAAEAMARQQRAMNNVRAPAPPPRAPAPPSNNRTYQPPPPQMRQQAPPPPQQRTPQPPPMRNPNISQQQYKSAQAPPQVKPPSPPQRNAQQVPPPPPPQVKPPPQAPPQPPRKAPAQEAPQPQRTQQSTMNVGVPRPPASNNTASPPPPPPPPPPSAQQQQQQRTMTTQSETPPLSTEEVERNIRMASDEIKKRTKENKADLMKIWEAGSSAKLAADDSAIIKARRDALQAAANQEGMTDGDNERIAEVFKTLTDEAQQEARNSCMSHCRDRNKEWAFEMCAKSPPEFKLDRMGLRCRDWRAKCLKRCHRCCHTMNSKSDECSDFVARTQTDCNWWASPQQYLR